MSEDTILNLHLLLGQLRTASIQWTRTFGEASDTMTALRVLVKSKIRELDLVEDSEEEKEGEMIGDD